MRRFQWSLFTLFVLLISVLTVSFSPTVLATTPTASPTNPVPKYLTPPIVDVELSGFEPLPPGIMASLSFGGRGGGPDDEENFVPYTETQWVGTMFASYTPNTRIEFNACGYKPNTLPKSSIQYPDGTIKEVSGKAWAPRSNCWQVKFPATYGMALGQYSLKLDSPAGVITREFFVTTQSSRTSVDTILKDKKPLELVYGLPPNSNVTVSFYIIYIDDEVDGTFFIAARTIHTDDYGMVALNLIISRSAPFKSDRIIITAPGDIWWEMGETGPISCSNSPTPRLKLGQNARITPGEANTLRKGPGSQTKIARIPGGTTVLITGGPVCGLSGRAYWRVVYNGKIGWTAEGEGNEYWMEPAQ